MKHLTIIFVTWMGLAGGAALADAPDVAAQPATVPAVSPVASPATEPAAPAAVAGTAQPTTQVATTPDATTQPADVNAVAATNPSTEPATQPVATTGPTTAPLAAAIVPPPVPVPTAYRGMTRILPNEYVILAQKSIFRKGDHNAPPPVLPVQPQRTDTQLSGPKLTSAEDQLVFDGTTEAGTQTVAYVEDRGTASMLFLEDGDKVAAGTVSEITFDSLDYTSKGRVVHVQVGQNLKGIDAPPATETIAIAPAPTTQSSGQTGGNPSSPGAPPAASGLPGGQDSDIVARLKAKRARELGN